MDQVGRVLAHDAALFESRHYEGDVALLEVAHAAVDQLGAAAAGAFAEVVGFKQDNAVAAGSGIDGYAHAGCAATDDGHIPGLGARANLAYHQFPFHRLLPFWLSALPGLRIETRGTQLLIPSSLSHG